MENIQQAIASENSKFSSIGKSVFKSSVSVPIGNSDGNINPNKIIDKEAKQLQKQAEIEAKKLQRQAEIEENRRVRQAKKEEERIQRAAIAEKKKIQRVIEAKQKEIDDEEYTKSIQEKRYKSLMHLLDKSQFYSNYITKKIDSDNPNAESRKRKGEKFSKENLPVSPKKKKTSKKQVLKEIVSNKLQKKMKIKANLSDEDIEEALALSSDEEKEEQKVQKKQKFTQPSNFIGLLHDYQIEGLQWLKVLNENGLNGILADEMGLGKTIQVIALICHLIENNQPGPYLIVAPLSTLPHWMMEFETFAPEIPVVLFHGPKNERASVYSEIKRKTTIGKCKTQPVIITSFEIPYMEQAFLRKYNWRYIIVDEGHRIKNSECLLVKVLKSCTSMNRLLLTGTPLQNNLAELWSLLNFLLPDLFNDWQVFESWFDVKELQNEEGTRKLIKQEEEKKVLASLREILKPFMLRRVKSEVNLQIPPKKELIIYTPITELQRDLYKAVLTRDIEKMILKPEDPIIKDNPDGTRPKRKCTYKQSYREAEMSSSALTNSINSLNNTKESNDEPQSMQISESNYFVNQKFLNEWKEYTQITESNCEYLLRMKFQNRGCIYKQIVNHPYLVYCPMDYFGLPKIDEDIVKVSGKLLLLDKLFAKLKAAGHKVLLFSTMTKILDMLEDYLSLRDYLYVRLDGSVNIAERTKVIKSFNSDPNIFLFLISTRAGGVGLNLTAADTVIIYDSDWNPQADIQAMARCHRIGQTKPVVVYTLCAKGTIDEQIIKRGEVKRKLEKMVISEKNLALNLNDKDTLIKLKNLLESRDYEVASAEKDVISDEELNKLVDRSDMMKNLQ